MMQTSLKAMLPISNWIQRYTRNHFAQDATAAFIVTMLLIPQSLAYAMLAGVPPEVGLYSSILPLFLYALFGTSSTLSVGPVAVISLMTAATLGTIAEQGTSSYLTGAITLALLSGGMLVLMGLLKLGVVANFLSHSVISGFITASGVLIGLSQLKHLLGVNAEGDTLVELLPALLQQTSQINIITSVVGIIVLAFLFLARKKAKNILLWCRMKKSTATLLAKTAPILGVLLSIAAVYVLDLEHYGVAITGEIPAGLPAFQFVLPSWDLVQALALPALMISIIGYVESISVGKTLAAKRREKVNSNQELIGLGMANVGSGLSGGFPVTGGFSRSVVNYDAGAVTQMASILAAIGITLASLLLTPLLYFLPKATLAATIIVAVTSLIDFSILKKTWQFSRSDFLAVLVTIIITLVAGVEVGVGSGVAISIGLHLYRTSIPHIAEVGLIEGTEHFRNVKRYHVETSPYILSLRPDESLFFANAQCLEEDVIKAVYERGEIAHVVVQCSAVNEIDFSALEMLESLNDMLIDQGVRLHFSEVKGPVMDNLRRTGFLNKLSGNVYISHFEAYQQLKAA